jgi:hypothetical protein
MYVYIYTGNSCFSCSWGGFCELSCVVSRFSWIWVLIARIIRPLAWNLQFSRFRVWLGHYSSRELGRQLSVLHYIPVCYVLWSLENAALSAFNWTLNWELEIYVLPWSFPLLGLKFHSAFDKRSRVISVYNRWIIRIYLCSVKALIWFNIIFCCVLYVFENHNSGVCNLLLACNPGVIIFMFPAKSSLFFTLRLHLLLTGYNIICGSLVI